MDVLKTRHACPLCRAPFRHFPAICAPLHSYLTRKFPNEMKVREEETKKLEKEEYQADSPVVAVMQSDASDFHSSKFVLEAFKCVDCQLLAVPPTVLTCGHIVCCSSSKKGALSIRRGKCPVEGCVGKRVAAENDAGERDPVCSLVDRILQHHVNREEYREAGTRSCSGISSKDDGATKSANDGTSGPASSSFLSSEKVILVGLSSDKGSRLNGRIAVVDSYCAATSRYSVKIDPPLKGMPKQFQVKSENLIRYVHFGVGCDGCGVYPISGRRYKCQDCSEEVGFDLCGDCYEDGIHKRTVADSEGGDVAAAGRFNQQHRPNHMMKEIEPDKNTAFLQWIQIHNSGLTMHQILQMLDVEENEHS